MSQNKNLLQLHCYACSLEIERWDLSANPELKDLRIGGDGYVAFDKVSILDCSNNHKLEVLMANLSQMSELYLDCPELQHLSLEGNSLSALDLSNCTKLVMLNFSGNNISHMNLQCPDLDLLKCQSNNLTTLDVSACPKLTVLYCDENQLQELDLTNNKKIEYLRVPDNKLQNLDASNLSKLKEFYCNNNELTDLMLNSLELTWVECQNNDLQSLDLSNLPALYLLRCYENQFETIDVSNNPELRGFFCNPMESLKTIYMSEGQDQLCKLSKSPKRRKSCINKSQRQTQRTRTHLRSGSLCLTRSRPAVARTERRETAFRVPERTYETDLPRLPHRNRMESICPPLQTEATGRHNPQHDTPIHPLLLQKIERIL